MQESSTWSITDLTLTDQESKVLQQNVPSKAANSGHSMHLECTYSFIYSSLKQNRILFIYFFLTSMFLIGSATMVYD